MKQVTIISADTPSAAIAAVKAMIVCDIEFSYKILQHEPGWVFEAYISKREMLSVLKSELGYEDLENIEIVN